MRSSFQVEVQPLLVAQSPPDAGGVVGEAFFVEYADALSLQVVAAAVGVDQLAVVAGIEADGHGVDGEIAAGEVFINGAGGHRGQGSGFGIGF